MVAGDKWVPDLEHYKKEGTGPLLYWDKFKKEFPILAENEKHLNPHHWHKFALMPEKQVKNMQINFGPQHPAAHGVLRLVLQLDGEVKRFLDIAGHA